MYVFPLEHVFFKFPFSPSLWGSTPSENGFMEAKWPPCILLNDSRSQFNTPRIRWYSLDFSGQIYGPLNWKNKANPIPTKNWAFFVPPVGIGVIEKKTGKTAGLASQDLWWKRQFGLVSWWRFWCGLLFKPTRLVSMSESQFLMVK